MTHPSKTQVIRRCSLSLTLLTLAAKLAAAGVSKDDIIQGVQQAANAQPISAYGKVVDQNGNPVSGVRVEGNTLLSAGGDRSRNEIYETTTDGQGLFKFENLHGLSFGFGLEKAGYEFNPKLYLDWWGNYKADPAHPAVFVMYKLQGAEPMVHTPFGRTIPCDGTAVRYNLLTGKEVASGGDLNVQFIRNPVQIQRGKPFEWTLTLTVPGGGLLEIHDPYPYEAPADGYQETVTIGTGLDLKNYVDSVTKNYYYKSADGKFGRLFVRLQADFQPPPTSFGGSIYLNPSGSRNLEFDSTKQVKSK